MSDTRHQEIKRGGDNDILICQPRNRVIGLGGDERTTSDGTIAFHNEKF
ncbi:hypothetical protein [Niveispirillum sp. BGYR6]|nr:hypothetical protein [Niveispirillum sp. BGYR6]MDG5497749.1 hypothetical protein [Niveispirillum sp. BGYR6]